MLPVQTRTIVLALAVAAPAVLIAWAALPRGRAGAAANQAPRVFELRTYYCNPGKLGDLNKRFRDHTCRLFEKHGIELIGFWVPQDEDQGKRDKLVYVIAFPSREAAKASWAAFQADPDWIAAKEASEKDGKIVVKVESVYLDPTDYSPMK